MTGRSIRDNTPISSARANGSTSAVTSISSPTHHSPLRVAAASAFHIHDPARSGRSGYFGLQSHFACSGARRRTKSWCQTAGLGRGSGAPVARDTVEQRCDAHVGDGRRSSRGLAQRTGDAPRTSWGVGSAGRRVTPVGRWRVSWNSISSGLPNVLIRTGFALRRLLGLPARRPFPARTRRRSATAWPLPKAVRSREIEEAVRQHNRFDCRLYEEARKLFWNTDEATARESTRHALATRPPR